MSDIFFDLPQRLQADILSGAVDKLNFEAEILEKDLWICAVLKELFKHSIPMVFKGGTSLSKAYGLINRFSEDVDITIDYQHFHPEIDLTKQLSRNALKKISDKLKNELKNRIKFSIIPHLEKHLNEKYPNKDFSFELSNEGEKLRIFYPSLFEQKGNYFQHNVLLEFCGKNSIEPNELCEINSFLSKAVDGLDLPSAKINVLSPLRTFWEKATLIHVECHRGRLHNSPDRLARHWYDLAQLTNSWVGENALKDDQLLKNVILHKKAFFDASYAHYDDCLSGAFRLIPNQNDIKGLQKDYKNMQNSGMLSESSMSFQQIMDNLGILEKKINLRA